MSQPVTEAGPDSASADAGNGIVWRTAEVLAGAVSLVLLGLVFFLLITPAALVLRLTGKRPLPLGFDPTRKSYWIERRPPGPPPAAMSRTY